LDDVIGKGYEATTFKAGAQMEPERQQQSCKLFHRIPEEQLGAYTVCTLEKRERNKVTAPKKSSFCLLVV